MSEKSPVRTVFEKISRILPEIKKPGRKVGFGEKLAWTALALVVYSWMGHTILYGLPSGQQVGQSPVLLNVVFAQKTGTLITLGIGPIVTAGLILQLLVGAELIKLDLNKSEDRALFTSVSKLLAIVIAVFQGAAYVSAGFFGPTTQTQNLVIFVQLVMATILIILLDELVQKGWGIGSGISLFIVAGVAEEIFVSLFSPILLPDQIYQGVILAIFQTIIAGNISPLLIRQGGFPDIVGFVSTIFLIVALIYIEAVRIEIPISYAKFQGYRAKYPVKLLYVSNVPIIFATTIFSNIFYLGSLVWSRFNPNNDNFFLNLIGTYRFDEEAGTVISTGGLAYYVIGPRGLAQVLEDPVRAVAHAAMLIVFSVLFAKFWVQISGLAPEKVAEQLISAGMQVPGFRRSPEIIASIIRKYIGTVTILGGLIIGTVASIADYLAVFGSGIGILLTIGILNQYYQLLIRERISEMYPAFGKLLGRE
ncbi:MAG: preprotein translocase subunit SecY [Candidatus Caldarchaeum sp.]|nr:preprotein translocase subunit SecY [Candidatus Caldarchaeum sp.]MCX8201591.1 preprotein translocase subunit SecY [Candidatus Caldarchaeum sp.]MDW8435446.1 preprotein translocase subunit SecY [Candidatus Caldarchaeum sp.]